MASVNKVVLIGNLGKDPEMRYLPNGDAVAVFSIATTESWKDKSGDKKERTDWHRIEFIGRTAEVCGEYLSKGDPVYIEGRIQYDQWEDKDGVKKTMTKIRGDRMQMLGSRREGGNDRGGSDDRGRYDDRGSRDSGRDRGSNDRGGNDRGGNGRSSEPARNDTRGGDDRGQSRGNAEPPKRSKLDDFDDDIPF